MKSLNLALILSLFLCAALAVPVYAGGPSASSIGSKKRSSQKTVRKPVRSMYLWKKGRASRLAKVAKPHSLSLSSTSRKGRYPYGAKVGLGGVLRADAHLLRPGSTIKVAWWCPRPASKLHVHLRKVWLCVHQFHKNSFSTPLKQAITYPNAFTFKHDTGPEGRVKSGAAFTAKLKKSFGGALGGWAYLAIEYLDWKTNKKHIVNIGRWENRSKKIPKNRLYFVPTYKTYIGTVGMKFGASVNASWRIKTARFNKRRDIPRYCYIRSLRLLTHGYTTKFCNPQAGIHRAWQGVKVSLPGFRQPTLHMRCELIAPAGLKLTVGKWYCHFTEMKAEYQKFKDGRPVVSLKKYKQ